MSLNLINCSSKIKWILLKSKFDQEVHSCTTHILDAHPHIQLYHTLYHAQAQYTDMIRSICKAAAPQCKKDAAICKAEVVKQECSEAMQHLMETKLDSLLMIEALKELLPWELHNIPKIVPLDQPVIEETLTTTTQTSPSITGPPLNVLLSAIPLPIMENQRKSSFPFVPIKGDNIITGPTPWRLIRKKPNGALILIHEDDFPIHYTSNILHHKLLMAMLTMTPLTLETMHLHLKDVITHYLNAKCIFIIPEHETLKESIYYNEPYNFIINGPISMQDYWHNTSTLCTLEDVLTSAHYNPQYVHQSSQLLQLGRTKLHKPTYPWMDKDVPASHMRSCFPTARQPFGCHQNQEYLYYSYHYKWIGCTWVNNPWVPTTHTHALYNLWYLVIRLAWGEKLHWGFFAMLSTWGRSKASYSHS